MSAGLRVRDLHAGYGGSLVLQGVDLNVAPGEVLAVLGRNGSGRSTLARALMGLIPARGELVWNGVSLVGLSTHERVRVGLGYVSETRDVFAHMSVLRNLRLGEHPGVRPGDGPLDEMLTLFPTLAQRLEARAGVLSGGEQQMLALARCWMGRPQLMLIDEPTEGLAPAVVAVLGKALAHFRAAGVAVLLIEQKRQLAMEVAQRCVVLGQGRVVFEGSPEALLEAPEVQRDWLSV